MKKITLPKILACLENESNEIIISKNLIEKARLSVERMTLVGR
jgi:quinolinate synthase